MEWRGYIGDDTHNPPFACDEGLINIQSVNSIYCETDWQTECHNVCPRETSDAYTYHYDRLLECNGTTGCANRSPPLSPGPNRCIRNNPQLVEYIQILGYCDIGTYRVVQWEFEIKVLFVKDLSSSSVISEVIEIVYLQIYNKT